jgi:hypothetical protein
MSNKNTQVIKLEHLNYFTMFLLSSILPNFFTASAVSLMNEVSIDSIFPSSTSFA